MLFISPILLATANIHTTLNKHTPPPVITTGTIASLTPLKAAARISIGIKTIFWKKPEKEKNMALMGDWPKKSKSSTCCEGEKHG